MSKKRIDVLLVERGLFESRSKAQAAIEAGGVRVNGQTILKPSDTVAEDCEISQCAKAWASFRAPRPTQGWAASA